MNKSSFPFLSAQEYGDGGKCVLQVQWVRPFFSDKCDITKHPQYKYLSDADPKNAFDVAGFLKYRLKMRLGDEFEVYELEVPDSSGVKI